MSKHGKSKDGKDDNNYLYHLKDLIARAADIKKGHRGVLLLD
jgi:hypothetical protein